MKLDLQQYILDSADKFQSTLEDEISSLDQTCFELQKQWSRKLHHHTKVGIKVLTEDVIMLQV